MAVIVDGGHDREYEILFQVWNVDRGDTLNSNCLTVRAVTDGYGECASHRRR